MGSLIFFIIAEVSSESEEAREGYSLRNRAPKPNPISSKYLHIFNCK